MAERESESAKGSASTDQAQARTEGAPTAPSLLAQPAIQRKLQKRLARRAQDGAAPVVQRSPHVGWDGARKGSNNGGEQAIGPLRRIPLDGLTTVKKAIAIVPGELDVKAPVEVLVHLHGHNKGWAEGGARSNKDPKGDVRDLDVEKIESQMIGAARPMIGMLPQGSGGSNFNESPKAQLTTAKDNPAFQKGNALTPPKLPAQVDKGFDVGAFENEVLAALVSQGAITAAPSIKGTVMSAHSGGGDPIATILNDEGPASKAPANIMEVVLFDAINGPLEYSRILSFVQKELAKDESELSAKQTPAEQKAYLAGSLRFRAVTTGAPPPTAGRKNPTGNPFYTDQHRALDKFLQDFFTAREATFDKDDVVPPWRNNYRVEFSEHRDHDTLVGAGGLEKALGDLPALPKGPEGPNDLPGGLPGETDNRKYA